MTTYAYSLRMTAERDTVAGIVFVRAEQNTYSTDQAELNMYVPSKLNRFVNGVLDNTNMTLLEDIKVTYSELMKRRAEDLEYALLPPMESKITATGGFTYIGEAYPGVIESEALWRVQRVEDATSIVTWADGNTKFDNIATDLTILTYSVLS